MEIHEMKTLKLKQLIATLWLLIALTLGSGIVPTEQFGVSFVNTAHAGCAGGTAGGAC